MKNFILLICTLVTLSSCSVVMAAKKDGVSVDKVQAARSRGQMLATGATVVSSDLMPNGDIVEVYQIQKERGSAARALMHGALDVSTCGLWEVVGTPIEACMDEKEYYSVRVTYDECENVKTVELL